MSGSTRYSPELRERVVRMVFDRREDYKSEWATVTAISKHARYVARDAPRLVSPGSGQSGACAGVTTDERARMKQFEREYPLSTDSLR